MTIWAAAGGALPALGDEPVALVVPLGPWRAGSDDRQRRSAARREVLAALAARLGQPDATLVAAADGRRRLARTALFASVAWRPGWAAAVLGRRPVGIDLEAPAEAANAADVILAGIEPAIDAAAWHGLAGVWAAREAVLKAHGRDLTSAFARWQFADGMVQGDAAPPLRVDLAAYGELVAAVAYAGA